jgi:hypothetical protein
MLLATVTMLVSSAMLGCTPYRFAGDFHQQIQDGYVQVNQEFDGYCDLRQDPYTGRDPAFYRAIKNHIHSLTILSRTFPKDSLTVKTWYHLQSIVDRTDSVDSRGHASPKFFQLMKQTFDEGIESGESAEQYKLEGRP